MEETSELYPEDDELMRILESYGEVTFYTGGHKDMNMCQIRGLDGRRDVRGRVFVYDHSCGGHMNSDIESARESYTQLYLTVMSSVWQIEEIEGKR